MKVNMQMMITRHKLFAVHIRNRVHLKFCVRPGSGGGTAGELTSALRETMSMLDGGGPGGAGGCAGAAARLLRALHATAPRFAERQPGGGLAQQDASECWTEIVRALQQRLPAAGADANADRCHRLARPTSPIN